MRFEAKKLTCFLRDQSQSDLLYNLKCEAANSLNLAVRRRSTSAGNSALLPSDGEGEGGGGGGLQKNFFRPSGPSLDPPLLKVFSFTVLFLCCTVEVPWFLEYHLEKQVIAWEFSKLDLMNCGENTKHTLVRIFFSSFIFWSFLTFR